MKSAPPGLHCYMHELFPDMFRKSALHKLIKQLRLPVKFLKAKPYR